jgi:hypothetical protein
MAVIHLVAVGEIRMKQVVNKALACIIPARYLRKLVAVMRGGTFSLLSDHLRRRYPCRPRNWLDTTMEKLKSHGNHARKGLLALEAEAR